MHSNVRNGQLAEHFRDIIEDRRETDTSATLGVVKC